MDKKQIKKFIAFGIASVVAIVIALLSPPEGLDERGMKFIGIFVWWVAMMCIDLIPAYMSTVAALVICVATGVSSTAEAFGAFGSTTCWLLIGAFGLAGGLGASGFMKRLALNVMRLFPGTYKGQVLGMTAASIVVGPCIPSTAAKCAVLVPIVNIISDEMGFKPHSKGATGLFSVVQMITNFAGMMFLTGALAVPSILAISGVNVTWLNWLRNFGLWGLVMTALIVVFVLFYYNPKKDGSSGTLDKSVLKEKCDELGPLTKKEIISLVVLVITIALWVTEGKLHNIPTYAVALGAWCVLTAAGLFTPQDLNTKILWSIYVLVGAMLGMLTILSVSGVSGWLTNLAAPVVSMFADKGVLLILVIIALATLAMFALINCAVTSTLFVALLGSCGIDPLIIVFVTFSAAFVYVLSFQQIPVIAALGMTMGRVEHKDIVPSAWAYIIINIISVLVSIPLWRMLGLM